MWFGSSVVECGDCITEALGSNPGRARYYFQQLLHIEGLDKRTILIGP